MCSSLLLVSCEMSSTAVSIWQFDCLDIGYIGAGIVPTPCARTSAAGAPTMMAAGSLGRCSQISVVSVPGSGVLPLSDLIMGPTLVWRFHV